MHARVLHEELMKVCPIAMVVVKVPDERDTWSFQPAPNATQAQIAAANNIMATIPAESIGEVPKEEWLSRWTNAEYLAIEKRRSSDNGRTAKTWDIVTASNVIDMSKRKVIALRDDLIAAGIISAARAAEIFK
jgi:hypothetical protein